MPGHTNILNPLDQLLAMFNDTTWRSDLTLGGWGPTGGRRYANGGWSDIPSIFAEDGLEVAINPKRPSADHLIAEAIEARANENPNGLAGNLHNAILRARAGMNGLVPTISDSHGTRQAINTGNSQNTDLGGDMTIAVNLDSATIAQVTYPKMKAMRTHELIVHNAGGAVPVGRAMPTGGGF